MMPSLHVPGMGSEIRSRLEKVIVEFHIQMMRLQDGDHKDGRHCAGKLTEGFQNVPRLNSYALLEFFTVNLR
jgi:hypothetical protein